MAAVEKYSYNPCMIGFNSVETTTTSGGSTSSNLRFRVINYGLEGGTVKWEHVSAFDGDVIGVQFGNYE
jgi:hypothetical protein